MDKNKEYQIKYEGNLEIGGGMDCYVLENGLRVLSAREMQRALKMVDETDKQSSGARLTRYLNQKSLKSFIYRENDQDHFKPIECYKGKRKINGYE